MSASRTDRGAEARPRSLAAAHRRAGAIATRVLSEPGRDDDLAVLARVYEDLLLESARAARPDPALVERVEGLRVALETLTVAAEAVTHEAGTWSFPDKHGNASFPFEPLAGLVVPTRRARSVLTAAEPAGPRNFRALLHAAQKVDVGGFEQAQGAIRILTWLHGQLGAAEPDHD